MTTFAIIGLVLTLSVTYVCAGWQLGTWVAKQSGTKRILLGIVFVFLFGIWALIPIVVALRGETGGDWTI